MNDFVDLIPLLRETPALLLLFVLWFQIREIGRKVDGFKEKIGERMGKVELATARLQAVVSRQPEK